jgi:transposase
MPRPRRFFPPEYKAEVIELIRSTGKTVGQVARELDLTETAVRQWVRQADLDTGRRSDGLTTAEREELRRLRRENRELREEREILRKAAVFFAFNARMRLVRWGSLVSLLPSCGWWLVRRCAAPPGGSAW